MGSTTDKNIINLLVNDDFINYVINPNLILMEMWTEYFDLHPDMVTVAEEAKKILLGETITNALSPTEQQDLETSLFKRCGLNLD